MNAKSSSESEPGTQRTVVPFLLSVRTHLTWWQSLQAWLWQGWQRLRLPRVQIQPPLQPARHKPFPKRPHQQRRQAVFVALNAAPAGLTRRQLIAHVRAVTGIGCSEKLITEWRRARRQEGEKERKSDAAKGRCGDARHQKHVVQWRLFLFGLVLGVTMKPWPSALPVAAQEITISPAPSATPTISSRQSPSPNPSVPRLLRIKLTINAPAELLVKTDDEVKAGQALTNRSHERNRLLAQRRVLTIQAQQIEAQLTTATESLELLAQRGADLPPISFASEQAAITKAEAEAAVTVRQVELQRQKLSVVRGPWSVALSSTSRTSTNGEQLGQEKRLTTDDGQLTFDQLTLIEAHETAKLAQAQDAARQAAAEVALQKAKLTSAQETRAFTEKQQALELSKQLLTARHQQQQAVLARSQLLMQIAALDWQIAQLAAVRSPFAGTIRRIEYEDMHDQTLTVLVYLFIR